MGIFKSATSYLGLSGSATQVAGPAPVSSAAAAPRIKSVTPLRSRRSNGDMQELMTFDPTSYADAKEIAEVFREGIPVIVNIAALSEADANRITHFLFGLKEGLQGHIKRIAQKIFVLTPYHVYLNDEEDHAEPSDGLQAI